MDLPSLARVKIIPASALRQPVWQTSTQDERQYGVDAVNTEFYDMYGPDYVHEPYGHNAFVDIYGDGQYAYYGGYNPYYPSAAMYNGAHTAYAPSFSAYTGHVPVAGYRAYPQPSPPRRSRTAPSRVPRPTTTMERRKNRAISSDAFDRRQFQAYSGPVKKPLPMYRKRKEVRNVQETQFGGGVSEYNAQMTRPYPHSAQSLRRLGAFYAPSYTTYPPSSMRKTMKKLDTKRYPIFARAVIKLAQLILAAAILGLVLGPMRGSSFHDFVIKTSTEYQGAVVGIAAVFGILTAVLLCTVFLANKLHAWRKVDAILTAVGAFCYLLASFVEAYYAACYPPNGAQIGLVCHRAEWIIATILSFINTFLYVLDFTLAWFSGVNML